MKTPTFLPLHTFTVNSKESEEYLAKLRQKVYTFWRNHFSCGYKRAMELYDEKTSKLKETELPSFYAFDSHYCENTKKPVVTLIHVVDQNKPLTPDNLIFNRMTIRPHKKV